MKAFRIVAWIVIVVMTGFAIRVLAFDSLNHGAGLDAFLAGSQQPWPAFIGQDLVMGLCLALAWIIWRQRGARVLDTVAWTWMILWWGNIVVAAYVLVALRQAQGDEGRFFMGARGGQLVPAWPEPGIGLRLVLLALSLATLGWLGLILRTVTGAVPIAGALLGLLPIALSFLLLAFPARGNG